MPYLPIPLSDVGGAQFALAVSSATSLTVPAAAKHAIINVNTQAVRWTTDGTAPTASKGIHVAANGQISFMDLNIDYRAVLKSLQVIQEAASATLDVLYFD